MVKNKGAVVGKGHLGSMKFSFSIRIYIFILILSLIGVMDERPVTRLSKVRLARSRAELRGSGQVVDCSRERLVCCFWMRNGFCCLGLVGSPGWLTVGS